MEISAQEQEIVGNTQKYPETPGIFGVYFFCHFLLAPCWPLNNSNNSVTNSNSMRWGEPLNNVKDFSQQ